VVNVWSGCADDLEESSYETGVVIDEIKSLRRLDPVSVSLAGCQP